MLRRSLAVTAAVALALPASAHAATPTLSALDLISLEIAYTTVMARYYRPVTGAMLLDGARTGIVAYLRGRGIATPAIPLPARLEDRWRAENDIDRDVMSAVTRYGARVSTRDLVANTIAGELGALRDPYTVLFRPAAYRAFVGFLDGSHIGGVGAELDVDPRTRAVRVVDVFPGAPAERAGLRSGDRITAIDGRPAAAGTPGAVAAQLRGTPGTIVHVAFARDGIAQSPVAIVRAAIAAPDVLARTLPGGVGYVRIRSFGARAATQFDAAVARMQGAHVDALVLDLRADGGGYRDAAVAIASRIVDGTIVTIRQRDEQPQAFNAAPVAKIDLPVAVLVDGDTASAAEIVAAAIQDHAAGTLIGERTFGKGLVQEIFPMPGGAAIKVTTASYRTPNGRDIEGIGIIPDLVVVESPTAHRGEIGHDPQLDRALVVLETNR